MDDYVIDAIRLTNLPDCELDLIFKELECIADKINLAKAHPYLTKAFQYHGRSEFKKISIRDFYPEEFEFILQHCGADVCHIQNYHQYSESELQLIADNCPQVKSLKIYKIQDDAVLTTLSRIPLKTLLIHSPTIDSIFKVLRNCTTLRKLVLSSISDIDMDSICIILEILDLNGVTPAEPFKFVVYKTFTALDSSIIEELSKCEKSSLLKIRLRKWKNDDPWWLRD